MLLPVKRVCVFHGGVIVLAFSSRLLVFLNYTCFAARRIGVSLSPSDRGSLFAAEQCSGPGHFPRSRQSTSQVVTGSVLM